MFLLHACDRAIIREQLQHRRVWECTQANWQALQAAIALQDWSAISTTHDINSAWEFFHRHLLSLYAQYSSHLVFSYHTHPPTHSTLNHVVGQLLWNNLPSLPGRQIWPKAISVHSTKPTTSGCPLSGETENNIYPTSTLIFQTGVPPLKPGAMLASLSLECDSPQTLPSIPMPSRSMEFLAVKPNLWAYHLAIMESSVVSIFHRLLFSLARIFFLFFFTWLLLHFPHFDSPDSLCCCLTHGNRMDGLGT